MRAFPVAWSLPVLLAALVSVHCNSSPLDAPDGVGQASLSVSMQALSANDATRVTVTVSGSHITPDIQYDLVKSGGQWTGIISNIPVGDNRLFAAEAFNSSGEKIYEGTSSPIGITSTEVAAVLILLQQAQEPDPFDNTAPFVTSLTASANGVAPGGKVNLTVLASDVDPADTLTYSWSATGGTYSSVSTASTEWTAPATEGLYEVSMTVSDNRGGTRTVTFAMDVRAFHGRGAARVNLAFNNWPVVSQVVANPSRVLSGGMTTLGVTSTDDDGDTRSYQWSDGEEECAGSFSPSATVESPVWTAPASVPAGNLCTLSVTVSDGRGGLGRGEISIWVSNDSETNTAPVVTSAFQSQDVFAPEVQVTFRVRAADPEGGAVTFAWSTSAGTLGAANTSLEGSEVVWTAPAACAAATVTATVRDALNAETTRVFSMGCTQPQLKNGSFEQGVSFTGDWKEVQGMNAVSITDWTVPQGYSVDIYRGGWSMKDGSRALDMSGAAEGAISQELQTVPGGKYRVSFALAGNPGSPAIKTLRVMAAGQQQDYTFDASGRSWANMGWVTQVFNFTASTSTTVLRFESLTPGVNGPAIDHASLSYQ